jgi:hypothetical protein
VKRFLTYRNYLNLFDDEVNTPGNRDATVMPYRVATENIFSTQRETLSLTRKTRVEMDVLLHENRTVSKHLC